MKTVLISGATGLVGKKLKAALEAKNYTVRSLSRKKEKDLFYWNLQENYVDPKAFENLNTIIHLAGAPISEKWTKEYKKELYDSRIKTAELLFENTKKYAPDLKTFITSSGANYYGTFTTDKIFSENEPNGNDFLGNLCLDWENAAFKFESLGTRVATVRTAAVLSDKDGMLKKLMPLTKLNLASPLGSGKQIVPWIHIDDLVGIYIHILENENLNGAFNACAPEIVNNSQFTKTLAKTMSKSAFLPDVPSFILKIILGEMSSIVLKGSAVSPEKIQNSRFKFQFPELNSALKNLIQ
ncbi:TIGR01777 family oxidoreductase [Moheibacter sediminis]|uniref:TIGR01777 family protein n=1 Tax=Moheibacter sediminis TaxID=1434700 RepID=A0A1W1ZTK5_9FLAO|nr:TIGR01777 family oxidoreductase [Moheibacter sediminis]SMC51408.1 hypothetical protein SAMN06296427_103205 [Moheibacter sediminis]